jgi:uncharacterized coiled-coil DUF342 family protein
VKLIFYARKGEETDMQEQQKRLLKQMLDFNKATFDNTFNAMAMLQEQTEKMANTLLERATLPEEGKRAVNEWVNAYKKGREEFKKSVDASFKKVEEYFGSSK